MTDAVAEIVAAIGRWQAGAPEVLVVAIDGHGAAGKTTIAGAVSIALGAALVHTDDYFYEAREYGDPRPMAQYYAWDALREEALEPAIARLRDGPLSESCARLIVVEGVSSASPALANLVDRAVFVSTPEPLRLERLHARIGEEEWDEEWLYAERLYFASRPPDSFDLIVSGAA
jgi:uridine kinase